MKIKCKNWKPGLPSFYWAQAKLDGIWLSAFRSRLDGVLHLHTSNPTDLRPVLGYCPWVQLLEDRLGRNTIVHGELHVPGRPASYVKTAIKDRDPQLTFTAFAVEGHGLTSRSPMLVVEDHARCVGLPFAPWRRCIHQDPVHYKRAFGEDLLYPVEGVVFKNGNLLDWHKWKPTPTVDCVVTDQKPGKGKYEGTLGALEVGVWDASSNMRTIAWVSGMTDEEREEMYRKSPVGRVVEVAYQYVGSQGRLRHPRFVRFRDDKLPVECTEDQLS